VDAFNSSILSMSVWRNSDVLDTELAHVVVPFLRREFPTIVTAKGLDLGTKLPLNQRDVGLDSRRMRPTFA
jgi:hypothetical protein